MHLEIYEGIELKNMHLEIYGGIEPVVVVTQNNLNGIEQLCKQLFIMLMLGLVCLYIFRTIARQFCYGTASILVILRFGLERAQRSSVLTTIPLFEHYYMGVA